jgi:hypothetical protein
MCQTKVQQCGHSQFGIKIKFVSLGGGGVKKRGNQLRGSVVTSFKQFVTEASGVMMEAASTSETSVDIQLRTR